jgi:hypothetical protein
MNRSTIATVAEAVTYVSARTLHSAMPLLLGSPRDAAALELIVARPWSNQRTLLRSALLSPELGLEGDNWSTHCSQTLADGSSDPDVQLTLMNTRIARLIAGGDHALWALAGDQLYADLDLSYENLPVGQRLAVGGAVIEITAEQHTGCAKYAKRFGADALRFINSPEGRRLNLRGIYARVVKAGQIAAGDGIAKI